MIIANARPGDSEVVNDDDNMVESWIDSPFNVEKKRTVTKRKS